MPFFKQAVLLLALTIIIAAVLFADLPGTTLYWRELQNTGHTFLFALVAILSLLLLQSSNEVLLRHPIKAYAAAFGAGVFLAVATELIQQLMHSDASYTDVLRDVGGIIAALSLYSAYDVNIIRNETKARKYKSGLIVLSLCVLLVSLAPLVNLSIAYMQRENAFPVILDLKAAWAEPFLRVTKANISAETEGGLVSVVLSSGSYPGLSMIEPVSDWSSYETLNMNIVSEYTEAFYLVLRIHDETHNNEYQDRFNTRLMVDPGNNNYRIRLQEIKQAPRAREMDMRKVSNITLFAAKVNNSLAFSLGVISLE